MYAPSTAPAPQCDARIEVLERQVADQQTSIAVLKEQVTRLLSTQLPDARHEEQVDELPCEFPRYSFHEWEQLSPGTLPDHAAVFSGASHHADLDDALKSLPHLADASAFLASVHADSEFMALPEFLAAGGLIWWLNKMRIALEPFAVRRAERTALLAEGASSGGYLYLQDFGCASAHCVNLSRHIRVPPPFASGAVSSPAPRYLLLGGRHRGLPFHTHEHFWQALISGSKMWLAVPPNSMNAKLHDAVGPHTFPSRAWHNATRGLPLGDRPLRCVQRPGDVFYMPDLWWHATLNLEPLSVSFGAKLTKNRAAYVRADPRGERPRLDAPFLAKGPVADEHLGLNLFAAMVAFERDVLLGEAKQRLAWEAVQATATLVDESARRQPAVLSEPAAAVLCLLARNIGHIRGPTRSVEATRDQRSHEWKARARAIAPRIAEKLCE